MGINMAMESVTKETAKILVVDDVEANRFVLRDIIQEMEYQPVLAEGMRQNMMRVETK